MSVKHDPKLLKEWLPGGRFRAYKSINFDNTSRHASSFKWTVGIHSVVVQRLNDGFCGRGFYVFLDREKAISPSHKAIAVLIEPRDVVYAGWGYWDDRNFVCRRLEIRSLRGLKSC